jgi:ankyrin repeat protein
VQLSAHIKAKAVDGQTALHRAASNGHVEALKTLV